MQTVKATKLKVETDTLTQHQNARFLHVTKMADRHRRECNVRNGQLTKGIKMKKERIDKHYKHFVEKFYISKDRILEQLQEHEAYVQVLKHHPLQNAVDYKKALEDVYTAQGMRSEIHDAMKNLNPEAVRKMRARAIFRREALERDRLIARNLREVEPREIRPRKEILLRFRKIAHKALAAAREEQRQLQLLEEQKIKDHPLRMLKNVPLGTVRWLPTTDMTKKRKVSNHKKRNRKGSRVNTVMAEAVRRGSIVVSGNWQGQGGRSQSRAPIVPLIGEDEAEKVQYKLKPLAQQGKKDRNISVLPAVGGIVRRDKGTRELEILSPPPLDLSATLHITTGIREVLPGITPKRKISRKLMLEETTISSESGLKRHPTILKSREATATSRQGTIISKEHKRITFEELPSVKEHKSPSKYRTASRETHGRASSRERSRGSRSKEGRSREGRDMWTRSRDGQALKARQTVVSDNPQVATTRTRRVAVAEKGGLQYP